jgi:arylsulfatase
MIDHSFVIYQMQSVVASMIPGFVKYPPRQKAAAFNLDSVLKHLEDAGGGANH